MSVPQYSFLHSLFHQHAGEMAAFLKKRWPKEEDVADIVQESFLRLSNYPQSDSIHNPKAFLFQTANNIAVDRHRRNKIRQRHSGPDDNLSEIISPQPTPDCFWEMRETLEQLYALLDELPELQRHAFVLFRVEGLSHGEISRRLGVSVSSSERYVRAAMLHISKRFSEDDG